MVHYLSRAHASLGVDIAVFSLTTRNPIAIPGVSVRTFPPIRVPFCVPKALLSELEAWRADMLHLHSVYLPVNTTLARWARRRGVPYVVTPHGGRAPEVFGRRRYLKLPYKHLFEIPVLNGAAWSWRRPPISEFMLFTVVAPRTSATPRLLPGQISCVPGRGRVRLGPDVIMHVAWEGDEDDLRRRLRTHLVGFLASRYRPPATASLSHLMARGI